MISYIPLEAQHLDAFADLFLREKGEVRTHQHAAYVPWSFWQNPYLTDDVPAVEIACEEGSVLGAMGVVPQIFLDGEQEIRGSFFVDWLVDSQQRRRRIGSSLIRRAAARFPICVHLGSTPEGYATCATLGARDCGRTATARRILRPWRWARATDVDLVRQAGWSALRRLRDSRLPALTTDLQVQAVDPRDVGANLERLSRSLARTQLLTLRSGARWHWLSSSPLYSAQTFEVRDGARPLGYALVAVAWRQQRLQATIGDVIAGDIESVAAVLHAALAETSRYPVDGITYTVSHDVAMTVAAEAGFEVQSTPMNGAWLHDGYERLLERSWFMSGGENLSIAAAIDYPVRRPALAALAGA